MKCWTRSCFTDEETQEENFGWNQLSCGPVLALISCTKLGIQLSTCSSPIVPKYISFLICASNLEFWTSLSFTDQETQKRVLGATSSLVGRFLYPSPVQSPRSIHCINAVQLFPNKFCAGNLECPDQSMLHISRNSGRDFWVEPAPLWAGSYTHLLYKVHDPFST